MRQILRVLIDVAIKNSLDYSCSFIELAQLVAQFHYVAWNTTGITNGHNIAEVVDAQVDGNTVSTHEVNVLVTVIHSAVGLCWSQQEQSEDRP